MATSMMGRVTTANTVLITGDTWCFRLFPTSPQVPVFHLGQRPPRQRLCLLGFGDRPWQFSSETTRPEAATQLTLRDLNPRPQDAEHYKTWKGKKGLNFTPMPYLPPLDLIKSIYDRWNLLAVGMHRSLWKIIETS